MPLFDPLFNRNSKAVKPLVTGYPTRLVDYPISKCTDGPKKLGKEIFKDGVKQLPVVFQPSSRRFWCIIVPKGFVALVNKHGKYVKQWGAGIRWKAPWWTISHLIPTQSIVYDTPVKQCPTFDNVMVTIDVTLILRIRTEDPEACFAFAYRLGSRGLDDHLKAFQEEAIRSLVRTRKYHEIYDLMNAQQDQMFVKLKRELNAHFGPLGVTITDLSVKNVHLPQAFADNMQEATVWHSKNEYEVLKQDYELRKIDIRELESKTNQKCQEDLAEFDAQKTTELAESTKKLRAEIAETNKQLAAVHEEMDNDTSGIEADGDLVVEKLNQQRKILTSQIESRGRAEAEEIEVQKQTYIQTRKANAAAEIAKNHAESLQKEAEAELYAAKLLASKRKYEAKMRSLQSMRGLSTNNNVCIAGVSGKDNVLTQLVANQRGGAVLGINAPQ